MGIVPAKAMTSEAGLDVIQQASAKPLDIKTMFSAEECVCSEYQTLQSSWGPIELSSKNTWA